MHTILRLDFHILYLSGSCDNEENWLGLSVELKMIVCIAHNWRLSAEIVFLSKIVCLDALDRMLTIVLKIVLKIVIWSYIQY